MPMYVVSAELLWQKNISRVSSPCSQELSHECILVLSLFSFLVHHYHRILPHLLQMTKVAPKATSHSGCLGIPLAIIPSKSEMVVATPVFWAWRLCMSAISVLCMPSENSITLLLHWELRFPVSVNLLVYHLHLFQDLQTWTYTFKDTLLPSWANGFAHVM